MTTSVAGRFAGKALADFLKTASSAMTGAVTGAVAKNLSNLENPSGLLGVAAKYPETTAKLIGSVSGPLTIGGAAAGVGALVNYLQQSKHSLPVQSNAGMMRPPAFATQQYIPGISPLTNEQMGESLLDQQRYQHQLELIQARHQASAGAGTLHASGNMSDIIGLAQKIYG
jgi:hypothetical protein